VSAVPGLRGLVYLLSLIFVLVDPSGRAVYGEGLRQLACWNCGFDSSRRHGCLSVVCVVNWQVTVFVLG